jgi:hypothetical protein
MRGDIDQNYVKLSLLVLFFREGSGVGSIINTLCSITYVE